MKRLDALGDYLRLGRDYVRELARDVQFLRMGAAGDLLHGVGNSKGAARDIIRQLTQYNGQ